MNNKTFCYWLQGYFEIAQAPGNLTKNKLVIIKTQLDSIEEPKGSFTLWLDKVCDHIASVGHHQATIDLFKPIIEKNLSSVFYHVIDDSYDGIDRATRHHVHEGRRLNDES